MLKPELLVPAGNLEKQEVAYLYGADACYLGVQGFSLRAEKSEIKCSELEKAINLAKKYDKKIYLALNSFVYEQDLKEIEKLLKKINQLKPHGLIIADPGVIALAQKVENKIPLHLSTQANTLNSESVKFWRKNGVQRIILARELSFSQLQKIRKAIKNIEIEIFVHGALCISYSGRCYLSKYLIDQDANQGNCVQPCRWEWQGQETINPERKLRFEQENGLNYILNSKDLCLLKKLPEIIKLRPTALKVEGRMKSPYYVALVTMIYRQAIDDYFSSSALFQQNLNYYQKELINVSHRDYTINFWEGFNDNTLNQVSSGYIQKYNLVGLVEKHDPRQKELYLRVRNEIKRGQVIEILNYQNKKIVKFKVREIFDLKKEKQAESAHNSYYVKIPSSFSFPSLAVVRAKIKRKK
ncbi:U32 family peptidase [Patescibacteria group bacterium]|nr:U32 family peptidase [Patescibacteria group bacterium]